MLLEEEEEERRPRGVRRKGQEALRGGRPGGVSKEEDGRGACMAQWRRREELVIGKGRGNVGRTPRKHCRRDRGGGEMCGAYFCHLFVLIRRVINGRVAEESWAV
jgi:hypothetical protein